MGCSASVETKAPENTEAQILQADNMLRRQLAATLISSDMNESSTLLKMLEQVQGMVNTDRGKCSADGGSKEKGKSFSKQRSSSKFNQLLESRRQQQDEVMGRSPRSNSLASIRAPSSPVYNHQKSRGGSVEETVMSSPTGTVRGEVGPAHSEESLRNLPYNAKLLLLRLLRHPIGFIYYWYFVHHLDQYSGVTMSPQVDAQTQENAKEDVKSMLHLNIVPNMNISHIPSKSTESPYESLFLLFTQLDSLVKLGTVPPQVRNPFEYIVFFLDKSSNSVGGLVPKGQGQAKSSRKYVDQSRSFSKDPFSDVDHVLLLNLEADTAGDSVDVLRKKCIEAQRLLQNQFAVQASIIHGHRVFYEELLSKALALEESFLQFTAPLNAVSVKFNKDPFYNPANLQAGIRVLLPKETLNLFSSSLSEYIRTLRLLVASVSKVDDQQQHCLRIIEEFERSGGVQGGYNPNYIFSSTFNEYYTDLDFYRVGIASPIVPSNENTMTKIISSFSMPYIATGGCLTRNDKNNDSDSDSDDDVDIRITSKAGLPTDGAVASTHYKFNALCAAPTAIYVPDVGLRVVKEHILAYLAAYTLSPFIISNYFQQFRLHLMNTTLIGSQQQATQSIGVPRDSVGNMGGSNGVIRRPAFFNSNSVPPNTTGPPQAILMECLKSSGLGAFSGYGIGAQSTIGAGPVPLRFSKGNFLVSNVEYKRETLHPLHGTSLLYGGAQNLRRKNMPGIVTKNVVGQLAATSLGALDLTTAMVSRELCKSFCAATSLAPANIGFCIISMITPSSSHRMFLRGKQTNADLDMLSAGMNTMKVVYTSGEFSKMCGGSGGDASNDITPVREVLSPRLGNRIAPRTAVPVARRPSLDPNVIPSTGIGYLSVLGREVQTLFIDDDDKVALMNDMMKLRSIHTYAKLATPDMQSYTQVVICMKPVFLRYRRNNGTVSNRNIQNTPLSMHSYSAQEYAVDERDLDCYDNTALGYQGTCLTPMFYVCSAIRVRAPSVIPGSGSDLHSTRVTQQDKDAVCSEYCKFPQPQPFFAPQGIVADKKGKKHCLEDQEQPEYLNPFQTIQEPQILGAVSAVEKKEMLRMRWAHDTAWLNMFPNVHDVVI